MAIRVAINGFGRIGRCLLRAAIERGLHERLDIVAINDTTQVVTLPNPDLKPETSRNYEIGAKSSWFDDRLQANGHY